MTMKEFHLRIFKISLRKKNLSFYNVSQAIKCNQLCGINIWKPLLKALNKLALIFFIGLFWPNEMISLSGFWKINIKAAVNEVVFISAMQERIISLEQLDRLNLETIKSLSINLHINFKEPVIKTLNLILAMKYTLNSYKTSNCKFKVKVLVLLFRQWTHSYYNCWLSRFQQFFTVWKTLVTAMMIFLTEFYCVVLEL